MYTADSILAVRITLRGEELHVEGICTPSEKFKVLHGVALLADVVCSWGDPAFVVELRCDDCGDDGDDGKVELKVRLRIKSTGVCSVVFMTARYNADQPYVVTEEVISPCVCAGGFAFECFSDCRSAYAKHIAQL